MQVIHSLTQFLQTRCPQIHQMRLAALMTNVVALVQGQTLTVTGLGRHSPRPTSAKHAIKQSDRLVGNAHLHRERVSLYRAVSQSLLRASPRPLITIDWSDVTYDQRWILLRAAVPASGRALTLYEEVHPVACYGNPRIQKRFLLTLATLLPENLKPILVTDAGFIGAWFREVLSQGWDYVGRIRPNLLYRETPQDTWQQCITWYPQATRRPTYQGQIQLARRSPLTCHFHLCRQAPKGRHQRTPAGKRSQRKISRANALRETSPWLVVTSLSPQDYPARRIMQCYRTRMQIEQTFRDIKNYRHGLRFRLTRSHCPHRLATLLLIGMLATLCVWLLGRLAEAQTLHYQFQANTRKDTRVLSLFFLGMQRLKRSTINWHQRDFKASMRLINDDIASQAIV